MNSSKNVNSSLCWQSIKQFSQSKNELESDKLLPLAGCQTVLWVQVYLYRCNMTCVDGLFVQKSSNFAMFGHIFDLVRISCNMEYLWNS